MDLADCRPFKSVVTRVLVGIMVVVVSLAAAQAASFKDKDWPCIQRKVPEISIGVVWAGPALDPQDKSWKKDPKVVQLVRKTTSRRSEIGDVKKVVDEFVEGSSTITEDQRRVLVKLFTGQFQIINKERREIISGIGRYARRQRDLAEKIKTQLDELNEIDRKSAATQKELERRDELNSQLTWDTRVYDEREQSLRYVCEVPVLLEQRLFALGRHIAGYLQN